MRGGRSQRLLFLECLTLLHKGAAATEEDRQRLAELAASLTGEERRALDRRAALVAEVESRLAKEFGETPGNVPARIPARPALEPVPLNAILLADLVITSDESSPDVERQRYPEILASLTPEERALWEKISREIKDYELDLRSSLRRFSAHDFSPVESGDET